MAVPGAPPWPAFRQHFPRSPHLKRGFTFATADAAIESGRPTSSAFGQALPGQPGISTERFDEGSAPLNEAPTSPTFSSGGEEGLYRLSGAGGGGCGGVMGAEGLG